MSKFKVGDRVRFVGAGPYQSKSFHVGGLYEVSAIEDATLHVSRDDEGDPNGWRPEYFELVQPASPSPVRTKTVKEIVPGKYGAVHVSAPSFANGVASVSLTDSVFNPSELREAARIFNELADALDEQ